MGQAIGVELRRGISCDNFAFAKPHSMSATAPLLLPLAEPPSEILAGPVRPDFLLDERLADLIEATAARSPERIALIFGDTEISYAELNARADVAASHLIDAGAAPGRVIGLWLTRGIDLLVMQVAITKTGAAWLPFDAGTPVDRIAVCLGDAQALGLVTGEMLQPKLGELSCAVFSVEVLKAPVSVMRRRAPSSADDPAYLIYTSGSTGTPKGIAISQRSICHFLRSENSLLGLREGDRVYQGFSVAFDMSFEEIWLSYLVGATLWIAPDTLAGDPEALPQALVDARIDVLHAVPTLVALFAVDVPNLRIINLGGEACPEALVARWAKPGRMLFNTYGPTECSVSASLAVLKVGEPVTIGRPLPNYSLMIVEPDTRERLALLARGETGELCIGGPGVALGYAGRPELTAEKFVADPWADGGRIYRTGDLAAIDANGNVRFYGRVDDQIKIRGFRVELGEIEIALADQPGVSTAAVVLRQDDGIDQLVAFYLADPQAAIPPTTVTLRTALAERLPPYMVPGRFEVLDAMPRLSSGKIDRKQLRAKPLTVLADSGESDMPETDAQQALFAALGRLFPGQPLRRASDFFTDLGGHSLLAARLASSLRADPRYARITLRDLYKQRRLDRIAETMAQLSQQQAAPRLAFKISPALRRWTCGAAQAVAIPLLVALNMMQWLAPFFTYHFYTGDPDDTIPNAVLMSVIAYVAVTLLTFAVTIAGKWLVLGRARAGRYPLWGAMYYRWWLADRLIDAAPSYLLPGSSLHAFYLRALGAKVGRETNLASMSIRVPDLLSIGDYVNVGEAVNFENARVEGGELILGHIEVADHGYVGSYAVMEGGCSIGEYGHLDALSALSEGERIPERRIFTGSPAKDSGRFDPAQYPPRVQPSRTRLIGEAVFFLVGALAVSILFFLPVFPTFALIDHFDNSDGPPEFLTIDGWLQLAKYFVFAFPASAVLIVLTALIAAGIRWAVLPRLKPGSWPVHSRVYLEKWLVNQIQENSLQVLHGVYATVFSPFWYRLLGAKVGRDTEISTAQGVVPDMLELGDDCFIADAVLLGDEEIDGGWMVLKPTVISPRSFVGNGAYVPDGTILPENVLIGVHSRVPPNDQMKPGDTWLGSPPIRLPAREQTQGYAEALTFRPSKRRRLVRALVEAFRIITPHAIVIAAGYGIVLNLMPAAAAEQWGEVIWGLTLSGLVFGLGAYAFVAALKWIFVGRYKKTSAPMWTWFVWSSEAVTNLYEGIAVPNFVRYLRGTPWLPLALNLLGSRIGKGVYLDTTDITEFDCVTIGDYSELNALCGPQTHLFEDRVMKIDHVRIGTRVTIGPRSIVLYSASVGDDARLGALTLVMKGERIPDASDWQGCPAAPA
jgi:non-ribosomal peptide synthetase-like protein